jgi:flagellar basal-body rod protein FlgG
MIESLYIAETGMNSQQKLIDVISNNIANSSTLGFKKSDLNFVDLVYQKDISSGNSIDNTQSSINNGAGVSITSSTLDFSVGGFKQTGNPFDIAIQGKGLLEVIIDDNSLAYTRAGRIRIDQDGYLTSIEGHKLSGSFQLPPDATDFKVSSEGNITIRLGNDGELLEIGQLELVTFSNTDGLISIGSNLYQADPAAGEAVYGDPDELGNGSIVQGVTEISNVSMTEEMVNLMLAQRGYQLNARIIQISDQLLDTINNLRR